MGKKSILTGRNATFYNFTLFTPDEGRDQEGPSGQR